MKTVVAVSTVGVPIVNEVTNDGVITALDLENVVVAGMTYGAWFKTFMLVALVLLVVERSISIYKKLKEPING